eukprot:2842594-Pyramimonas_sp.AAC.1
MQKTMRKRSRMKGSVKAGAQLTNIVCTPSRIITTRVGFSKDGRLQNCSGEAVPDKDKAKPQLGASSPSTLLEE